MKFLYWAVVALVAAVLALFAGFNWTPVEIHLWPLPFVAGLPLALAILGALLVGFAAGVLGVWIGGRHRRRELRQRGRRVAALERELAAMQGQLPGGAERMPAPPPRD